MKDPLKGFISKLCLGLSDLICINMSLFFAITIADYSFSDISKFIPFEQMPIRYIAQMFISVACVAWFWIRLRHYSYRKPFWFELKEILRTLLIFAILDLSLIAFSKWDLSRTIWAFTWFIALILVPLSRSVVKNSLSKIGIWKKKSVIIGSGKNALEAYKALQSEEILGFSVSAFVCSSGKDSEREIFGIPVIEGNHNFWASVDPASTQFIVALEFEQQALRDDWLKELSKRNCRSISVIPSLRGVPLYGTDMSFIFSHEVMILRVNNNLMKHTSRFLKRSFDLIGSALLLLLLMPVFLILTVIISRDGKTVVYGHERVGKNGRKFKCLKFRSMVINSKEVLDELLKSSEDARNEWAKDFKLKNDPRVTKIGHFLRKTSLDELPQLWNVFVGEMSLVGPRPVIYEELERYAGDVDYYLMAKPGMTGLWQVSGRNDIDYDTRVYFDAWYVKNWSLWNDIAILFKTIKVVLKRDGAY
ncbi:undecaprenyl-phosphate galactose phosphotransferase WbaP [Serratia fonticola]|uniref:undecaprenyl-phosphate galactose phosphotransferase WbaP n=1 Tax=Serratia fonticola TaxID=47917 RepID=UPI003AAF8959